MDNFIDKLAQKFNAQEVIKANSQAETAEYKKLQMQVAEYEKILQEMRKLNYKNVELTDKITSMIGENAEKLEQLQETELQNLNTMRDLTEEQKRLREEDLRLKEEEAKKKEAELASVEESAKEEQETLEALFRRSDEYMHKENIKVYRNVQAVIIEELKAQTEALALENQKLSNKFTGLTVMQIMTLVLLLGSIVLNCLTFFGITL